jgi:hypothetical protein
MMMMMMMIDEATEVLFVHAELEPASSIICRLAWEELDVNLTW